MKSNREKISYSIGLETGKSLKNQFKDMDLELLYKGFQDALSERTPALDQEEVSALMNNLRGQIESQQRHFLAQVAEQNKKTGEAFMEANKHKEDVVTLASGLQYKVLSEGEGESPTLFDVVTIHYRGSFIDGRVFESTYERSAPQTFPLNRAIPGWMEALKRMKVGDRWQLFVPSYLAYGEMGFGNEIQPNTTLIFDMELLKIN